MLTYENHSLLPYNTFGIDEKARFFSIARTLADVQEWLEASKASGLPTWILGGGSNVLFTKPFEGWVLKIELGGIELLGEDDAHFWVKAGAGENWHEFVLHCVENGWQGVENLSLIPGTVGAAPVQNIGAYGVELTDVFHELEAVQIATGQVRTFSHAECTFGYRDSIFKQSAKGQYIITSVTFRLRKAPQFNVSYGAIQDTLKQHGATELSIRAISDAVVAIRQSKLPDPRVVGNCGSFFKNPEVLPEVWENFRQHHPTAPHFAAAGGRVKIPAGWLIEQCGWKGKTLGRVGTYEHQALVLVNRGGASGEEAWALAQQIRQSVADRFGIAIEPEVNIC